MTKKKQRQDYGSGSIATLLKAVFGIVPKKLTYREYLKTPIWKQKALEAKRRAGFRCQVCNSPDHIQTHHRRYDHLFYEPPEDLTVLCNKCHKLFSDSGRLSHD
jgi:5-methylcytosine-specific restriction endonuclease McrA